MKTIKETAAELLLNGEHINKSDFRDEYKTFTLTQRIEELRNKDKWDVKSKTIPGKHGMVEYWLEPEEINRIHSHGSKVIAQMLSATEKGADEQLADEKEKVAETSQKTAQNEHYEQIGLGLLGGHNY